MIFTEVKKITSTHHPFKRSRSHYTHYIGCIWVFPKIGLPQNGWFVMKNLINMDDLGVPLFAETSIWGWFSPVPLQGYHHVPYESIWWRFLGLEILPSLYFHHSPTSTFFIFCWGRTNPGTTSPICPIFRLRPEPRVTRKYKTLMTWSKILETISRKILGNYTFHISIPILLPSRVKSVLSNIQNKP